MDKDLKSKLDAVFQQDQTRVVTAQTKQDAEQAAREQFLVDFLRVREEIIKPAMQEIADYVADKGWICDIKTKEERENGRGGTDNAGISLTFFRGNKPNYYDDHKYPHWSVVCDKSTKTFTFFSSTIGPGHGGSGGGSGGATLAQISKELIQAEIGKYILKLMSDAAPYGTR